MQWLLCPLTLVAMQCSPPQQRGQQSIPRVFETNKKGFGRHNKTQIDKTVAFTDLITLCTFENLALVVPGQPGRVQLLLNAGFWRLTNWGTSMIFISGNLSYAITSKPRLQQLSRSRWWYSVLLINCPMQAELLLASATKEGFKDFIAQTRTWCFQPAPQLPVATFTLILD